MMVLNPHGSDETVFLFSDIVVQIQVLNPHGSDETKYTYFKYVGEYEFLTHTVQMKPLNRC